MTGLWLFGEILFGAGGRSLRLHRDHAQANDVTPKIVAVMENSAKTQSSFVVDDTDALGVFHTAPTAIWS